MFSKLNEKMSEASGLEGSAWRIKEIAWNHEDVIYGQSSESPKIGPLGYGIFLSSVIILFSMIKQFGEFKEIYDFSNSHMTILIATNILLCIYGILISLHYNYKNWKLYTAKLIDYEIKDPVASTHSTSSGFVTYYNCPFRILCEYKVGENTIEVTPTVKKLFNTANKKAAKKIIDNNFPKGEGDLLVHPQNELKAICNYKGIEANLYTKLTLLGYQALVFTSLIYTDIITKAG